jgi:hypothetical protein
VSAGLDFVLLRDDVAESDLLKTIQTEIRLFVDLRRSVGIWRYGRMLKC